MYTGPDISEFNGAIDFSKIKGNYDFVLIRCGYGSNYENQDDEYFKTNADQCEKLGIPYGVYLYSYAKNTDMAKSEADHTLRLIKGRKVAYGVWYDLEDSSLPTDNSVLADICEAYLDRIISNDFYAGIYASLSWLETRLNSSKLDKYDKWVAQWNSTCDYNKPYGIWQFTSDASISGLSGRFDMNYAYKNYPEITGNMSTVNPETPDNGGNTNGGSTNEGYKVIVTANIGLNVRSGPGTSYGVTSAVPLGTILTITQEQNNWGEISTGGWVCLDYTALYTGGKQYTVTPSAGLNIRSGPGTNYSILNAVPQGTVLTINSISDGWGLTSDGGYVCMEYLS